MLLSGQGLQAAFAVQDSLRRLAVRSRILETFFGAKCTRLHHEAYLQVDALVAPGHELRFCSGMCFAAGLGVDLDSPSTPCSARSRRQVCN